MSDKLKNALTDQKQQTEQHNQKIPGMLGITINGARTVEVANRNSYVYVRLRNSQNELIQAFNNRVAPSYNLPVIVERQGNRYVVLDVDTTRYDNNWGSYSPYLPRHGNTHSFDIESGGGGDIVWVYPRQFMPLLAFPSGSVGSSNVIVSPYTLKKENGTWMYVGNTGTASFTPYNPVSSGSVMGLIALDTTSGNPYLLINSGSVFHYLTGSSQIYPYIPALTNPAHIPIAAIRLVSGTSKLTWDNIYDVRQFVHGHTSGSAGSAPANPPISGSVVIRDEGVDQGSALIMNFVGDPVSVSVAGGIATVTVTATASGSSGGATFTGTGNSAVLTSPAGTLFTPAWLKWGGSPGAEFVEFGADKVGKEPNAGKMGYETFGSDFFYIVGAASGSASRKVLIFDDLYVNDNFFVNGGQQIFASKQVTNGDSHDHIGGDGSAILFQGLTDAFNNAEGNPSPIGSGTPGTSTYAARRNHVHDILNGSSILGGTVTITGTAGTFQSTLLSVTLPEAGVYELTGNVRGNLRGNGGAGTTAWWMTADLFNTTDAAAVANSERLIVLTGADAVTFQTTVPINITITGSASKIITLRAARNGNGTPAWTSSAIESNTAGRTNLSYRKVA